MGSIGDKELVFVYFEVADAIGGTRCLPEQDMKTRDYKTDDAVSN